MAKAINGKNTICENSETTSAFGFAKTKEISLMVRETPMPNMISTSTEETNKSIPDIKRN